MSTSAKPVTTNSNSTTVPVNPVIGQNASQIMGGVMGQYGQGGQYSQYPNFAYDPSNQYTQNGQQLTAGLTDPQYAAINTAMSAPGYQANYANAQQYGNPEFNATHLNNQQSQVGAFNAAPGQGGVQDFMSPYQQTAMKQTGDELTRQFKGQLASEDDRAAAAGAFGGSAQAMERGEMGRQFALGTGNVLSNMANQGYQNASQNYFNAAGSNRADLASGLQQTGVNNAAMQQGMNDQLQLAGAGIQDASQLAQLQSQAGSMLQNQDQKTRDASYGQLQNMTQYGLNLGNSLSNLNTGQIPAYGTNSSGTQTQTGGPGKGAQLLGAGLQGAGGLFQGGSNSAAAGISAIMSDENEKDNISDVDDDAGERALGAFSGMPVKTWRYSKQAQDEHGVDGEQHTGPMAQDVEKGFGQPAPKMAGGAKGIDVINVLGNVVLALQALEKRTAGTSSAAASA